MPSRKNQWRKAGRFEFRRETKRFHDGSPWTPVTDILYIRIKGIGCVVVEPYDWKGQNGRSLCILIGTYRAATVMGAAQMARAYLLHKLKDHNEYAMRDLKAELIFNR